MTKSNIYSIFSKTALALAMVIPATATTVSVGGVSVAGEGMMSSVANATVSTFDNSSSLPAGFAADGTTPANPVVQGSLLHVYTAPTGDNSNYLTTGTGQIVDTIKAGSNYFGFYWGSADTYNLLALVDSSGNTSYYTGSDIPGLTPNGASSYFVNFFATPGTTFTQARFVSVETNAFEFDNVTTATIGSSTAASATPEPGTVAMLSGGLLIVAGTLRRRKA